MVFVGELPVPRPGAPLWLRFEDPGICARRARIEFAGQRSYSSRPINSAPRHLSLRAASRFQSKSADCFGGPPQLRRHASSTPKRIVLASPALGVFQSSAGRVRHWLQALPSKSPGVWLVSWHIGILGVDAKSSRGRRLRSCGLATRCPVRRAGRGAAREIGSPQREACGAQGVPASCFYLGCRTSSGCGPLGRRRRSRVAPSVKPVAPQECPRWAPSNSH